MRTVVGHTQVVGMFFFSSRRRHTRWPRDWSSDVCSSDLTKAGAVFEGRVPGADITFNFGSSSTLATQITNGAPADVFASADEPNMQKIVDAELVDGSPSVFAGNHLEIAVAPGNPKRIAALADLARPGIIVIVAAPTVPAGR